MDAQVSLWLIPKKKDEEYLSVIIRSLCEKYKTTPFPPHITVSGGAKGELNNIISIVKESVQGIKLFSVELEKIGHSDEPKKTLFIQLQQNAVLKQLNENLSNKFHNKRDQTFSPHISLIYKAGMKEEDKLKEIKRLTLKKQFIIDRIAVVSRINPGVELDNAKWQTLFEKQLR